MDEFNGGWLGYFHPMYLKKPFGWNSWVWFYTNVHIQWDEDQGWFLISWGYGNFQTPSKPMNLSSSFSTIYRDNMFLPKVDKRVCFFRPWEYIGELHPLSCVVIFSFHIVIIISHSGSSPPSTHHLMKRNIRSCHITQQQPINFHPCLVAWQNHVWTMLPSLIILTINILSAHHHNLRPCPVNQPPTSHMATPRSHSWERTNRKSAVRKLVERRACWFRP